MKRFKVKRHGKHGKHMRKKFSKGVHKTKAPNLFRGIMRGGKRF